MYFFCVSVEVRGLAGASEAVLAARLPLRVHLLLSLRRPQAVIPAIIVLAARIRLQLRLDLQVVTMQKRLRARMPFRWALGSVRRLDTSNLQQSNPAVAIWNPL
jgi:hypothetical protein